MTQLEKITLRKDEFGGTEVVDGAGILPKGTYFMSERQVYQMAEKKLTRMAPKY